MDEKVNELTDLLQELKTEKAYLSAVLDLLDWKYNFKDYLDTNSVDQIANKKEKRKINSYIEQAIENTLVDISRNKRFDSKSNVPMPVSSIIFALPGGNYNESLIKLHSCNAYDRRILMKNRQRLAEHTEYRKIYGCGIDELIENEYTFLNSYEETSRKSNYLKRE